MPFNNPIVGGNDTLIRAKIQSENYVPGVDGWRISRNGNAEFNDIIVRGSGIFGPNPGRHIEINETFPSEISFHTGETTEVTPGRLGPQFTVGPGSLTNTMTSPVHSAVPGGFASELILETNSGGFRNIYFNADKYIFSDDVNGFVQTAWTDIPLAGTWVDTAGARADYMKDETGRVSLRGLVISGGAATIGNMPTGFRPTQSTERIMRGNGGVVMCAVLIDTNGVMTVTANLGTAQASGVRLDAFTYPTN